jgi:hypothetical protein
LRQPGWRRGRIGKCGTLHAKNRPRANGGNGLPASHPFYDIYKISVFSANTESGNGPPLRQPPWPAPPPGKAVRHCASLPESDVRTGHEYNQHLPVSNPVRQIA